MKFCRFISFVTLFIVVSNAVTWASAPYTIIANPGGNASTSIRLNWHTDENSGVSVCHYTHANDYAWKNIKTLKGKQELCTVFDSIFSKTPNGQDFYEQAQFIRNTLDIDSLIPGTKYKYYINGDSIVRYFKTAPLDNNWTAAIISDFHAYTPLPKRTTSAMQMLSILEQQKGEFDLILHVGDITAWGGSYSFWRDLYSDVPFRKYAWAGVNGNHDNMSRGYAHQSNEFFRNVNNNPSNGYHGEMGVCYHFTYGNTLFIMLNNESMKTDEGLQKAQQWVKNVIHENHSRFIVVMEHYQWFYGESEKASQYNRWKQLFDECSVDLAIAANNHIYVRTNALYQDTETDGSRGTVYIQTPSSDNERGQALQSWNGNHPLIKHIWNEGANTVGALFLNGSNEELTITLHDRNGNIIDTAIVKAKR